MLPKNLIIVVAIGFFCLIGYTVAQQFQRPNATTSTKSLHVPLPNTSGNLQSPAFNSFTPSETSPTKQTNSSLKGDWLLRMNDGEIIIADLAKDFAITLETDFGPLSITSDRIVSLRIVGNENEPTSQDSKSAASTKRLVVATTAGDLVSGRSNLASLEIDLPWGSATADAKSIDFICNRKFGTMTIVNDPSEISYVLSTVQLQLTSSRIVEQTRASRIVAPGKLVKPSRAEHAAPMYKE